MVYTFIPIRVLDVIDVFLLAFLMYRVYLLIRGTIAINIFVGIFSFYLLWQIVKALNMSLLGSILGQIIGVGVIGIIIVFQQEIRRFLLLVGTRYFSDKRFFLEDFFTLKRKSIQKVKINSIVKACRNISESKLGALIVIARKSELFMYAQTGDLINAETSTRLLESIFFKNNPLHDGAVIIKDDKILAARCVLPISDNFNLSPSFGMRHRAAIGMVENTDSIAIVVSEENGKISVAKDGTIQLDIVLQKLEPYLEDALEN